MPVEFAPAIRKQYLHLVVYRCQNCQGPVVAGSMGIRESDITQESELTLLGSACLSCGNRQPIEPANIRRFPPVQWETSKSLAEAREALRMDEEDRRQRVAEVTPAIP